MAKSVAVVEDADPNCEKVFNWTSRVFEVVKREFPDKIQEIKFMLSIAYGMDIDNPASVKQVMCKFISKYTFCEYS